MDSTLVAPKSKIAKPLLPRQPRTRPDWPIQVYSYDIIEFIGERPKWLNRTDKAMRECWNFMVLRLRSEINPLLAAESVDYSALRDIELKYKQTKWVREMAAGYANKMSSHCREEVVSRFLKTMRMIRDVKNRRKREGKKVHPDTGYPQFKARDRWSMHLPFVFGLIDGKSCTFGDMYEERTGCSIWRIPEASNRGHNIAFSVSKPQKVKERYDPIRILASVHRLPPMNAVVKKAVLIETKCDPLPPQYQIQFTLEIPPSTVKKAVKTGRVAGFDIGWRRLGDDIRIAVMTDNAGHSYEIKIPRGIANRSALRERKRFGDSYGKVLTWDDLWASQERRDNLLEEKKHEVMAICSSEGDWPQELLSVYNNKAAFDKTRAGGMKKTLRILKDQLPNSVAIPLLESWLIEDTEYRRRQAAFWLLCRRMKKDIYNKLAAWLSNNFDAVAFEGDFDLSEIAEGSTDEGMLKKARKNRQMVGISNLRGRVEQTAQRTGMEWIPAPKAGTTSRCSACGDKVNKTGKHLLMCVNGHELDRDRNASTNLRNMIEEAASISAEPVEIPADLQRYLRLLPISEAVE